ncbi:MAG: sugar transferase [Octadecabacter sp.]
MDIGKTNVFMRGNLFPARASRSGNLRGNPVSKRIFDLVVAVVLLPILCPMIALLYLVVRCDGGSGFFGQVRIGQHGKAFKCWKLRTMMPDADAALRAHFDVNPRARIEWERDFKLDSDPRITRLGNFLRTTSLDEIPQIWNVIKGEMSFVGPRPVVRAELAKYGKSLWAYRAQRPGVTGLWQVSGRNSVSYDARVAMDVEYLTRSSLWFDIVLMLKTAGAVVQRTGK